MNQQLLLKFLRSEVELRDDENIGRKETEKNLFFKFNLKLIKKLTINWTI